MNEAAVAHYLDQYNTRARPAGPAWLNGIRASAIEQFRRHGFPNLRQEDWKYTDVRPIASGNFIAADAPRPASRPDALDDHSLRDLAGHELVFIDGAYHADYSRFGSLEAGVTLLSLAEALGRDTGGIQPYFDQSPLKQQSAFDALNSAFSSEGVYLYVPDGVRLERPIHLLFFCGQESQGRAHHYRNLIVLGREAEATVIETYAGVADARYFTNAVTEFVGGEGALLRHYKLERESQAGYHVGNLRAGLHRDSRLESHSLALGGALVRNNIHVDLTATGAGAMLNGLYAVAGRQHIDHHTCVEHRAPRTVSAGYYRGVLDGNARGVFNGRVVVHPQAQKTEAQVANANLLLSGNAEVDTKPELEIYADDVKCGHGATVGQLDENMLFYLRTRAIDARTARSLLTLAFVEDVIRRIGLEPVRRRVELAVVGKLPDADLIRNFMK
jgi:Fe-S cluster assembly protein SufD